MSLSRGVSRSGRRVMGSSLMRGDWDSPICELKQAPWQGQGSWAVVVKTLILWSHPYLSGSPSGGCLYGNEFCFSWHIILGDGIKHWVTLEQPNASSMENLRSGAGQCPLCWRNDKMTLELSSIFHVCLVKIVDFFFPDNMMQPYISLREKRKRQQMSLNSIILVEAPCCPTLGQGGLRICWSLMATSGNGQTYSPMLIFCFV